MKFDYYPITALLVLYQPKNRKINFSREFLTWSAQGVHLANKWAFNSFWINNLYRIGIDNENNFSFYTKTKPASILEIDFDYKFRGIDYSPDINLTFQAANTIALITLL